MVSQPGSMTDANPKQIRTQILGGGRDVGRSCVVTTLDNDITIMFDCGVHPGYADEKRFPDFKSIPNLANLSLVLITHFHLDHAAALPLLTETLGINVPVYMTSATIDLARLIIEDFLRTSNARGQHVPFDSASTERALSRVRILTADKPITPPELPSVRVTAHHAGHALGACMFSVETDAYSVVYTGDYATLSERHLRAARLPACLRPNLLITEATYCNIARRTSRRAQEDALMRAVRTSVSNGGRVLITVPAMGRVQEICAVFDAHWSAHDLRDIPVYVAEGLASRACDVYGHYGGAPCEVRPFNRAHWHRVVGEGAPSCILFATPGNLATGLSLDVFREWAGDERNLVVVPGFSFSNALAASLGEMDICCQVFNMSMSSHADAAGIRFVIRALMPDNVMLVHGEEGKVMRFQKALAGEFGVPVLAPRNGEVVEVDCPAIGERQWRGELGNVGESEIVKEYLKGQNACEAGFCGVGYEERKIDGRVPMLRSGLEERTGIEKISDREYRYMECVLVSLIEEEQLMLVEWTRPEYRPHARELLNVIDKQLATQLAHGSPQQSSDQS